MMESFRRDYSWQKRKVNIEHLYWFNNLIHLHRITQDWYKKLDHRDIDTSYLVKRVLSPNLKRNHAILETVSQSKIPSRLDDFLFDEQPSEFLRKLEHTIWILQSWSLRRLFEETHAKEQTALMNALEQSSWSTGKSYGEETLKSASHQKSSLKEIARLIEGTPLTSWPHFREVMFRRVSQNELIIDMNFCPHHSPYLEVISSAKELCELHYRWFQGFFYSIHPQLEVQKTFEGECCLLNIRES